MSVSERIEKGGRAAGRTAEDVAASSKRRIADAENAVRNTAHAVTEAAEDAVQDGKARIGNALRKAQETAQDAKEAIVAGAGSTLSAVKDVAVEKADAARETLSDVGERLAATLDRASESDDADALKSRVLTSVAQGLTTASDALRHRSVADLSADVKMLARRHPGVFMAAAAVAGFAAARFIRSSGRQRLAGRGTDYGQGPRL